MNPTPAILPFRDDSEYIAVEHEHLVAKAARIGLHRRLDRETGHGAIAAHHWPVDDEYIASIRRRLAEAEVVERGTRDQIDERLAVHRGTEGIAALGLDVLCKRHDLTEDERLVLIITAIVACSGHHAEAIFETLCGTHHYTPTVEDLVALMDPRDMAAWARARLLFHAKAPLLAHGLIKIETHPTLKTTIDLLDARVSITFEAFATLTGVEELVQVDWGTETPATT